MNHGHTLTFDEKMFSIQGSYFEPEVAEMLTLTMIHGTRQGLKEMNTILLSESVGRKWRDGRENDPFKTIPSPLVQQ